MHGTLLLDTDAGKMARYLQVSKAKMQAKGIDSVRSRVVNLIERNPEITPERMSVALKDAFRTNYAPWQPEEAYAEETAPAEVLPLYEKYQSWDWRFGETPVFDMTFENRFSWGCMEAAISAEKGRIKTIQIYTDAMDADLAGILKDSLQGCKLSHTAIETQIQSALSLLAAKTAVIADLSCVAEDLCAWFREIL